MCQNSNDRMAGEGVVSFIWIFVIPVDFFTSFYYVPRPIFISKFDLKGKSEFNQLTVWQTITDNNKSNLKVLSHQGK